MRRTRGTRTRGGEGVKSEEEEIRGMGGRGGGKGGRERVARSEGGGWRREEM